ncbi:hypothetical protein PAPYR_8397 [Paratrimastix pyriformis]|uniref:Uncharacterized protein n=1 Tax=Paratrimastix pyriformis TaxID=342808 RepID=A0ABQ8UAM5_9EUKA|nr:hypothetical protein PAPYR_8397 [Paratrimastix pyriformis]
MLAIGAIVDGEMSTELVQSLHKKKAITALLRSVAPTPAISTTTPAPSTTTATATPPSAPTSSGSASTPSPSPAAATGMEVIERPDHCVQTWAWVGTLCRKSARFSGVLLEDFAAAQGYKQAQHTVMAMLNQARDGVFHKCSGLARCTPGQKCHCVDFFPRVMCFPSRSGGNRTREAADQLRQAGIEPAYTESTAPPLSRRSGPPPGGDQAGMLECDDAAAPHENMSPITEEALRQMLDVIQSLVYLGGPAPLDLLSPMPLAGTAATTATTTSASPMGPSLPSPQPAASPVPTPGQADQDGAGGSNQERKLQNTEAFLTLQKLFLRCSKWPQVQQVLLDRILGILCAHPANYKAVERLHPLANFVDALDHLTSHTRAGVIKLLEHVAFTSCACVPFQELTALANLLSTRAHPETVELVLSTIHKFVCFEPTYQDRFRDAGAVYMATNLFLVLIKALVINRTDALALPEEEAPEAAPAAATSSATTATTTSTSTSTAPERAIAEAVGASIEGAAEAPQTGTATTTSMGMSTEAPQDATSSATPSPEPTPTAAAAPAATTTPSPVAPLVADSLPVLPVDAAPHWAPVLGPLIDCLCVLLRDSPANVEVFRGGHTRGYLMASLGARPYRKSMLNLVSCLVAVDKNQQSHDVAGPLCCLVAVDKNQQSHDVAGILGLLGSASRPLALSLLQHLRRMLRIGSAVQAAFGEDGGFAALLQFLQREAEYAQSPMAILAPPLEVLQQAADTDSTISSSIADLPAGMPEPQPTVLTMVQAALRVLTAALRGNDLNKSTMRVTGGYESLAQLLYKITLFHQTFKKSRDLDHQTNHTHQKSQFLIKLDELTATQSTMRVTGGYESLAQVLREMRFMSESPYAALPCLDLLLEMACDMDGSTADVPALLCNPQAVVLLLRLLPYTPPVIHADVWINLAALASRTPANLGVLTGAGLIQNEVSATVKYLMGPKISDKIRSNKALRPRIGHLSSFRNLGVLTGAGLVQELVMGYSEALEDPAHPDHCIITDMVCMLGAYALSALEMRTLFHMVHYAASGHAAALLAGPDACLSLGSLEDRAWPPSNGYSLSLWVCIETPDMHNPITLFSATSPDRRSTIELFFDAKRSKLSIRTGSNSSAQTEFPMAVASGVWRHVILVHSRGRLIGASTVTLYLDGQLLLQNRLTYPGSAPAPTISLFFGHSRQGPPTSAIWSLGPVFMVEECLGPHTVAALHQLGPQYSGVLGGGGHDTGLLKGIDGRAAVLALPDSAPGPHCLEAEGLVIGAPDRFLFAFHPRAHSADRTKLLSIVAPVSAGVPMAEVRGDACLMEACPLPDALHRVGGVETLLLLLDAAPDPEALRSAILVLVGALASQPANMARMDGMVASLPSPDGESMAAHSSILWLSQAVGTCFLAHVCHVCLTWWEVLFSFSKTPSLPAPAGTCLLTCGWQLLAHLLERHVHHLTEDSWELLLTALTTAPSSGALAPQATAVFASSAQPPIPPPSIATPAGLTRTPVRPTLPPHMRPGGATPGTPISPSLDGPLDSASGEAAAGGAVGLAGTPASPFPPPQFTSPALITARAAMSLRMAPAAPSPIVQAAASLGSTPPYLLQSTTGFGALFLNPVLAQHPSARAALLERLVRRVKGMVQPAVTPYSMFNLDRLREMDALSHFLHLLRDPHPIHLRVALLSALEPLLGATWIENDLAGLAELLCSLLPPAQSAHRYVRYTLPPQEAQHVLLLALQMVLHLVTATTDMNLDVFVKVFEDKFLLFMGSDVPRAPPGRPLSAGSLPPRPVPFPPPPSSIILSAMFVAICNIHHDIFRIRPSIGQVMADPKALGLAMSAGAATVDALSCLQYLDLVRPKPAGAATVDALSCLQFLDLGPHLRIDFPEVVPLLMTILHRAARRAAAAAATPPSPATTNHSPPSRPHLHAPARPSRLRLDTSASGVMVSDLSVLVHVVLNMFRELITALDRHGHTDPMHALFQRLLFAEGEPHHLPSILFAPPWTEPGSAAPVPATTPVAIPPATAAAADQEFHVLQALPPSVLPHKPTPLGSTSNHQAPPAACPAGCVDPHVYFGATHVRTMFILIRDVLVFTMRDSDRAVELLQGALQSVPACLPAPLALYYRRRLMDDLVSYYRTQLAASRTALLVVPKLLANVVQLTKFLLHQLMAGVYTDDMTLVKLISDLVVAIQNPVSNSVTTSPTLLTASPQPAPTSTTTTTTTTSLFPGPPTSSLFAPPPGATIPPPPRVTSPPARPLPATPPYAGPVGPATVKISGKTAMAHIQLLARTLRSLVLFQLRMEAAFAPPEGPNRMEELLKELDEHAGLTGRCLDLSFPGPVATCFLLIHHLCSWSGTQKRE